MKRADEAVSSAGICDYRGYEKENVMNAPKIQVYHTLDYETVLRNTNTGSPLSLVSGLQVERRDNVLIRFFSRCELSFNYYLHESTTDCILLLTLNT